MKEKVLEAFRELGFVVDGFGKALEVFREQEFEVEYFGDNDYIVMRDKRMFIYSYGDNEEKCLIIAGLVPYDCEGFNVFQLYALAEKLNTSLTCIKAYMSGHTLCLAYERGLLSDDEDLKSIISNATALLDEECEAALKILGDIEELMTDEKGETLTLGEQLDGHECVDMGLSVKWAMCNVGAITPMDDGGFYAWGETDMKNEYTEADSKTFGKDMEDIAGDSMYDVARAKWGGSWRLPTEEEMIDLVDNCTWTWTTVGGVKGSKATSLINGNSIFFPAAGHADEHYTYGSGSDGFYWSSTPDTDRDHANVMFLQRQSLYVPALADRFCGGSVRPVSDQ